MQSPDEQLLGEISDCLEKEADLLVAIAFGSVVNGSLRSDSDLDIAVLARQPLDSARRRELVALLADLVGRPVDLVDLRTSGIAVSRTALSTGRRLFCRDQSALASLISRMLLDSADFLPYRERILRERRAAWIGRTAANSVPPRPTSALPRNHFLEPK